MPAFFCRVFQTGKISDDKKSIIIKDYQTGMKVHVKVEYEDGTVDEFVKSPCYIDPFITFNYINFSSEYLSNLLVS